MERRRITTLVLMLLILITSSVASAQSSRTVYITTQRFEHGLMVWRSDTGLIWVLGDSGQVLSFPVTVYSAFADNTIGTNPARLRPILGFGKVWGHNAGVRDLLGWPVLPEIGFDTRIDLDVNQEYTIVQLDGSLIHIESNNTWSLTSAVTPPGGAQTTTTVQAAFQQYEYGFMIWRGDTGAVTVFFTAYYSQAPNGVRRYSVFPQATLEALPDNSITDTPDGLPVPVNGFGRIWGGFRSVRSAVGNAVGAENSYQMTIHWQGGEPVGYSLPDGRTITLTPYGTWSE